MIDHLDAGIVVSPSIKFNVVIVDDHVIVRKALCLLLQGFDNFTVLFEAVNGKDFIKKLKTASIPHLVLLDTNMPEMDGYKTVIWLRENHPEVKVIAMSISEYETILIRMFEAGVDGHFFKGCSPDELLKAINAVM